MQAFVHAHATHPDWRMALALVAAQLDAQRHDAAGLDAPQTPTLGWVYLTQSYAAEAHAIWRELQVRWPGTAWVGAIGIGICASGVEYFEEPAMCLMLSHLPTSQFRVFSGVAPLAGFDASTAQVHADPSTSDLGELLNEMSRRTRSGYLFGGVAHRQREATGTAEQPTHLANGVFNGGLSGVAFGPEVALVSRVTQGCQPISPVRRITAGEHNLVLTLDGEAALDVLLRDLALDTLETSDALPKLRQTLVGLSDAHITPQGVLPRHGQFGSDTRVRHLIGLDPARRGLAIADSAVVGQTLTFCTRHREAAQRDLIRICTEIRDELEPEAFTLPVTQGNSSPDDLAAASAATHRIAGAIYVSCAGRGGPHFGDHHAELTMVRRALGDVPLVGFFAAGEIARHHLYGYTGVLTVFLR